MGRWEQRGNEEPRGVPTTRGRHFPIRLPRMSAREGAGGQGTPFRAAYNALDSRFHWVTEMHYTPIAKTVTGRSGPIEIDAKAPLRDTSGAVESLPDPTASTPERKARQNDWHGRIRDPKR